MKKFTLSLFSSLVSCCGLFAHSPVSTPVTSHTYIVGGGIIGALESYYAYKDAEKQGQKICVTIYEKGDSFESSKEKSSTNTSFNIVPSLTIDEILSVVPRGNELVDKLAYRFNQPGGIRVDDVPGVNESVSASNFKTSVGLYGADKNHDDRTLALLTLGKKSMDLWQQMYNEGDAELKAILESSNFNPCREPLSNSKRVLHDGYRIDLIYAVPNGMKHALAMKADYDRLGYKNCALLSPDEVAAIDPYLADYCKDHSTVDANQNRVWKDDSAALWRPGGCIDTHIFLPKFYAYLKKVMGQYKDSNQNIQDCFQLKFGNEVTAVEFDQSAKEARVIGLKFKNGTQQKAALKSDTRYVFCPGEAIGTLHRLGFNEPAFAGFAGPSLFLRIPLTSEQVENYNDFSHCMEVHNEGIVLAWQARFLDNTIFIGVAGTKAFYGDKEPNPNEEFAKNRNLVQLNMINNVLPEFISVALGYDTHGKTLTAEELTVLENKGIANRWVGRRAVAYDGFPTLGTLYCNDHKVSNARCTTHLGSGGVSFGPGVVYVSRMAEQHSNDAFIQKILSYADSRRIAN